MTWAARQAAHVRFFSGTACVPIETTLAGAGRTDRGVLEVGEVVIEFDARPTTRPPTSCAARTRWNFGCGEAKRESSAGAVEAALALPKRGAPTVDALCLVKGVDVATAFPPRCRGGRLRFPSAVVRRGSGLAPSERSSGETESRGGITRAGNSRVRRALVEASWHVPMSTRHPKKPRPGHGVAPAASRHAAKCNRRLRDRRDAMSQAGKRPCVANCATAREMACWVWAIAPMVR